MDFQGTIFWQETVSKNPRQVQPLPEKVDVAVIGAGITGLSAARELGARGAKTVVLEAREVGWGASSRNGGMVLTGLKLGVNTLVTRYGMEAARVMYAASLAAIDAVENIVRAEKIECDFARCGHLALASKPGHFEGFRRSAEVLGREFNHPVRIVSKQQLHDEVGSDVYHGGLVDETSGGLNPARYVAGLAQAAERAGAKIVESAIVQRITAADLGGESGWQVTTSRGVLWARNVLVATSGYSGAATPALQKKIIPIGSFIIVTEALPEAMAEQISPRKRMMYNSRNFLHYYRLTPDRRMLFGGRAAFFPETKWTVHRSAEILQRGMTDVFPQLTDAKIEYAWGGTLDFAFDMMPHAGQLNGIYFALGYAGHGVAMATYLGGLMAQAIASGDSRNPFSEIPFPGAPLGLYDGRPWFLPFAGLWYRFLDWVH